MLFDCKDCENRKQHVCQDVLGSNLNRRAVCVHNIRVSVRQLLRARGQGASA